MNLSHLSDHDLAQAYRRNETWLTDTFEDESKRMRLFHAYAEEFERRGLPLPEIRREDHDDETELGGSGL